MKIWISAAVIAMLTGSAALAQPTSAQTDAIKSNCRSDYMKSCMSVPPGGQAAFDCLKRNMASLSPACQSAVNAIKPPAPAAAAPAPAPAPAAAAPAAVVPAAVATPPAAQAPAPVASALVAPAPAPAVATAPVASPASAAATPVAKPVPAARTAAKPASNAPAPTAAAAPTAAQQNAIRQSCRNDFIANCSGVQPGGQAALACLQTNASKLSPACRTAVSAIGGAPKPAVATTAPATAAVAPAAPAAVAAPMMPTAEQQAAVKNTCRADFRRNCRNVQPGGPEALMCLQANASKLSPNCKTSVAAIMESTDAGAAVAATPASAPAAKPEKRTYATPGIIPAVRVGRRIRERLEDSR